MSGEDIKKFVKGDKGIRYTAGIAPWEINKGEFAIIRFILYNPTKIPLEPVIFVEKIEKEGLLSSPSFLPLSVDPRKFWVPTNIMVSKLRPEKKVEVYIPVFTTKSTEPGKYKIYIDVKVPTPGTTISDVAKAASKAVSLATGIFKTKRYLRLKVKDSEKQQEEDPRNMFIKATGIAIEKFGTYYPYSVELNLIAKIQLVAPKYDGRIDIVLQKAPTDDLKKRLLSIYSEVFPENPAERKTIEIDDTPFDFSRLTQEHKKAGIVHRLDLLGFSEKRRTVVSILAFMKDYLYQQTMDLITSIKFLED